MPRAMTICSTPGCGTPAATRGQCRAHSAEAERRRGTRQQRGLGADYQRARTIALANATRCATCQQPFTPDNPATGGHVKARRLGGTTADGIQAECRRCNMGWQRTGN